jgi:hypothetical protein
MQKRLLLERMKKIEFSNKNHQLHKNENILLFHLLDLLDSTFFILEAK